MTPWIFLTPILFDFSHWHHGYFWHQCFFISVIDTTDTTVLFNVTIKFFLISVIDTMISSYANSFWFPSLTTWLYLTPVLFNFSHWHDGYFSHQFFFISVIDIMDISYINFLFISVIDTVLFLTSILFCSFFDTMVISYTNFF